MSFENVDMTILGSAKKVIINKDETIIIDGAGEKEVIKGRVDQIREEMTLATSEYDKEKL